MRLLLIMALLPALAWCAVPPAAGAAHFDDPDHLLAQDTLRGQQLDAKLDVFERTTGVRIMARYFAKSPPADQDKVPGAFMRSLAGKLGTLQRGALVAYFADEKDWRIWIGDESTSAFLGRPASAQDLVEGGAFHQAKETFLNAAQPKTGPEPATLILKLQTDAVLAGLISRLTPR